MALTSLSRKASSVSNKSITLQKVLNSNKNLCHELNVLFDLKQQLEQLRQATETSTRALEEIKTTRDYFIAKRTITQLYTSVLLSDHELLVTHLGAMFQVYKENNPTEHPSQWKIDPPQLPPDCFQSLKDSRQKWSQEISLIDKKMKPGTITKLYRKCSRYHNFTYLKLHSAIERNQYLTTEYEKQCPELDKIKDNIASLKVLLTDLKNQFASVICEIGEIETSVNSDITDYKKLAKTYFISEYDRVEKLRKTNEKITSAAQRIFNSHRPGAINKELQLSPRSTPTVLCYSAKGSVSTRQVNINMPSLVTNSTDVSSPEMEEGAADMPNSVFQQYVDKSDDLVTLDVIPPAKQLHQLQIEEPDSVGIDVNNVFSAPQW